MQEWVRRLARPCPLWTLIAFVVALVVWAVWSPGYFPSTDAESYDASARQLLATGHLAETWPPYYEAWRPHGYTLFAAAIYWIGGETPSHVVFVQTLLFAGMVGMLVAACGVVSRNRIAQHLCGLLAVGYVPFYKYVYALLAEQLHFFLVAAAILLLARLQRSQTVLLAAGTGALLGLAALTKSYSFYFPVLAVAVIGAAWLLGRMRDQRALLRLTLAGLVAFVVAVSPLLIRNWLTIGTPTKLTSYGGYNLFLGNYSLKVDDWRDPVSSAYYDEIDRQVNDVRREYRDEAKQDEELTDRATGIIFDHPVTFMKKAIWQARLTVTASGRYGTGLEARLTGAQYIALLLLAAIGAVLRIRRARLFVTGLLAFSAYVVLIFSVTFTMNRLKEPMMPAVIVLAGLALGEARRVPALSRRFAVRES